MSVGGSERDEDRVERVEVERPVDDFGPRVSGDPEELDVSRLLGRERRLEGAALPHGRLEAAHVVHGVDLEEVGLDLERAEAPRDLLLGRGPRALERLRREEKGLALLVGENLREVALALVVAVGARGVEVVDALLERGLDRAEGLLLADLGDGVAAEGEERRLEAGSAKRAALEGGGVGPRGDRRDGRLVGPALVLAVLGEDAPAHGTEAGRAEDALHEIATLHRGRLPGQLGTPRGIRQ